MNDGPAGSGLGGRVVSGADGTPNSLAALRLTGYQARERGAGLDIVHVSAAGASEVAEASGYEMLDIALRQVAPVALSPAAAARSAAGGRVWRETGSDVR